MVDPKMISGIFNDFLAMYLGKNPIGIKPLREKYKNHPVLLGLLSNQDAAVEIPVPQVMRDIYDFYKAYQGRDLAEEDWQEVVEKSRTVNLKWKENEWCRRLLLEMMDLLDSDYRERDRLAKEVEKEMEEAMRQGAA